jgi:nucleotide-binding universal stress UspA family protein
MNIEPGNKPGEVAIEPGLKDAIVSPQDSAMIEPMRPAFRLRKILVPVDFSECSSKALQYAIAFARQFGAELVLLHVVHPYPPMPEMGPVDAESMVDAHEQMESFQKTVGSVVPCKTMVRTGSGHGEIIAMAKELGVDLIVISTHGRTGLEHVLLGSTAEKVVRHAGCPVLVVRQHQHEFIVGASDGIA